MKRLLQAILRKAGWEVRRLDSMTSSTMTAGLKRLAAQDVEIRTVLDVGASNGCWSSECMKVYPEANYVLFEPQPVHSESLDEFAGEFEGNVTLVKKAVGNSEGKTYFDASDAFGGALLETPEGESAIEVDLTTIDATLSGLSLEAPYLLKLDTHGFEKSILEGAENSLAETNAVILEAYNHKITEEALLFWEICEFLGGKGFRPFDLVDVLSRPRDHSLWQMDLFFLKSDWDGFSYVHYE